MVTVFIFAIKNKKSDISIIVLNLTLIRLIGQKEKNPFL